MSCITATLFLQAYILLTVSRYSYSKSLSDASATFGALLTDVDFSAILRFRWRGFFPAPGVRGTDMPPSVDVTGGMDASLKQACVAFERCAADMLFQASTVRRCLACVGDKKKSPRPHIARSASTNCAQTRSDSLPIRSGSCCGLHCTDCFRMWFTLSQLLLVQALRDATTLSRSMEIIRLST